MIASLCAIGAVAGLAVATASAVSNGRDCADVSNDPSRFGTFGSARLCWWEEAWDVFAGHSPQGAGAGTFEIARRRSRSGCPRRLVEPHSVPLQHLSDGGVAGLALFVALIGAAAAVCIGALRRLGAPERAAAAALVALPVAYLGHALVDYDWNFLAVTAPTMVALGVLAGAGRAPGSSRRRPLLAVAAVIAAATVFVSFSFPQLADRMERSSTRAVVANDLELARDRALWARFFNSLAVETVFRARPGGRGTRLAGHGGASLHPGGRAPAEEPGDVVHGRDLRVRGTREPLRCVPLPEQRVHARSVGESVGRRAG